VITNLILLRKNRELQSYIDEQRQSSGLNVGEVVSPIEGLDVNGSPVGFRYNEDPRKTIILVFSPDCDYCTQTMPLWRSIIARVDKSAFRIFAVSLYPAGSKEYASAQGLDSIPVMARMFFGGANSYKFGLSPETILVGANGTVEGVWKGLVDAPTQKEMEQALGIEAPK